MEKLKKITCVIYTRYSSSSEKQERNSTARQLKSCHDFLEHKPNWEVIGTYSDEAQKGDGAKKELTKLKEEVLNGTVLPDYILVDESKRFSRKGPLNLESDFGNFQTAGIKIVDCFGKTRDLNNSEDQLVVALEAYTGNKELKDKSHWAISGAQNFLANDDHPTRDSFGWCHVKQYDNQGERISCELVSTDDSKIVKEMFETFVKTKSVMSLVLVLRKSDKYAKTDISNSTIKAILRNSKHVGDTSYHRCQVGKHAVATKEGEVRLNEGESRRRQYTINPELAGFYKRNTHKGIIEREVWDITQQILDHNQVSNKRTTRTGRYKFSGKLVCGACGATLSGSKTGTGLPLYVCNNSKSSGHSCRQTNRKSIREADVEDILFSTLKEQLSDWMFHLENILLALPLAVDYLKNKSIDSDKELKEKMSRLEEKETSWRQNYEMFLDSGFGDAGILEKQQAANKEERAELENDITNSDDLSVLFDTLNGRSFSPEIVTSDNYFDQLLIGATLLANTDVLLDKIKQIPNPDSGSYWCLENLKTLEDRIAAEGLSDDVATKIVEFIESPEGISSFAALVTMSKEVAKHFMASSDLDPSWLDCLDHTRIDWHRPKNRQEPKQVLLQYRGLSSGTFSRADSRGTD